MGFIFLAGSGSPVVTGNTVDGITIGVERAGSSGAATISGNTIRNCTTGIKTYQSSPEIYNNYLESSTYGIRLATSSSPDIHDNDIYDNGAGIYLEQSQPSNLKWNNFGWTGGQMDPNGDAGVYIWYLQSGNTFMDNKGNNLYDSEITKDVRNFTTTTLKARGNYWNTDGANYTGPVDASNPLASHNSDAGPGGALGKPVAHDFGEPVAASLVPEHFALEQNYPNPFNPSTVIAFSLPEESVLTLIIYDILGRQVRTLVSRVAYNAGIHQLVWNGRDDSGQTLPSGVYVYRLRVTSGHKTFSESRKLVLLQ